MLCEQCGKHDAIERDGSPIIFIFGTDVAGRLCHSCAMERQALWIDAGLARMAAQDPSLTPDQLEAMRARRIKEAFDLPAFPDYVEAALRRQRLSGEADSSPGE